MFTHPSYAPLSKSDKPPVESKKDKSSTLSTEQTLLLKGVRLYYAHYAHQLTMAEQRNNGNTPTQATALIQLFGLRPGNESPGSVKGEQLPLDKPPLLLCPRQAAGNKFKIKQELAQWVAKAIKNNLSLHQLQSAIQQEITGPTEINTILEECLNLIPSEHTNAIIIFKQALYQDILQKAAQWLCDLFTNKNGYVFFKPDDTSTEEEIRHQEQRVISSVEKLQELGCTMTKTLEEILPFWTAYKIKMILQNRDQKEASPVVQNSI